MSTPAILVTGGAGFIGSALVRRLASRGHKRIIVLDKLGYSASREAIAGPVQDGVCRLVTGDIGDRKLVADLLDTHRPEIVFHLAAETHVDRSIGDPRPFLESNICGTFELLEAVRAHLARPGISRDAFRLVHVSTDEVYGELGAEEERFDEGSPYRPRSPYAASKAASDHLARAWFATYRVPVIVTNCTNNYGPYQFPEKLIPLMILKAIAGQTLPVYGRGEQVRDWLHVDDHADALIRIGRAGKPGETYLIGARNERRNIDMVRAICASLDTLVPDSAPHDRLISFVEDRPGHDFRYAIDPQKTETELGWRASIPLDKGIQETVAWYLSNSEWWRPIAAQRYAGERLGLVGS